jgi:hypothetical protein
VGRPIITIVLVDVSRRKQPHPGGQLGRHIQHPLTRGGQLLGQQMAHPARAFDRPGALQPGLRPPQQPLRLSTQARTRNWPSGTSAGSIATAVCEALCGSIPIITATMGNVLLPVLDLR